MTTIDQINELRAELRSCYFTKEERAAAEAELAALIAQEQPAAEHPKLKLHRQAGDTGVDFAQARPEARDQDPVLRRDRGILRDRLEPAPMRQLSTARFGGPFSSRRCSADDSRAFVSDGAGRERAAPLPPPVRNDGPSSGPWCRCAPIFSAGKHLRTGSVRSTSHSSGPCSWTHPNVRHKGARVARS